MTRTLGILALLGCIVACGRPIDPPPRAVLRADVVGCLRLFERDGRRIDTSSYNASHWIALRATAWRAPDGREYPGLFSAQRLDSTYRPVELAPVDLRGPRWSADARGDSIRIDLGDGFSGALVVLDAPQSRRDTLKGRIVQLWDFGPGASNARRMYAVRAQCARSADSAA